MTVSIDGTYDPYQNLYTIRTSDDSVGCLRFPAH